MRRIAPRASLVFLGCLAMFGCSNREVRVVYRDGEGGVIGIPQNTNRWPYYYREQAARAMARHFPQDGYLVVREVEVPKGSRTTFEGSSQVGDVSPIFSALKLAEVKGTKNQGEQRSQQILETHVFYVKNDPHAPLKSGSYSPLATYTPAAYDGPIAPRLLVQIEPKAPKDESTRLAGYTAAQPKKAADSKGSAGGDIPMPKPVEVPKFELPQ